MQKGNKIYLLLHSIFNLISHLIFMMQQLHVRIVLICENLHQIYTFHHVIKKIIFRKYISSRTKCVYLKIIIKKKIV